MIRAEGSPSDSTTATTISFQTKSSAKKSDSTAATSGSDMVDIPSDPSLADAIRAQAARLGIDPIDLGTSISYETAGSFDPWKKGPRTQWGEHRGLIQWGEPQRKQYGVHEKMSAAEQMVAVGDYLRDRGVQPGMGLLDVYSTINAGRPGLYDRSDANNGGAPGSVADKVSGMAAHRVRASLLLDGKLPAMPAPRLTSADAPVTVGGPRPGSAPMSLAPGGAPTALGDDPQLAALVKLAQKQAEETQDTEPLAAPFQFAGMMNMGGRRRGTV